MFVNIDIGINKNNEWENYGNYGKKGLFLIIAFYDQYYRYNYLLFHMREKMLYIDIF